eukprot:gene21078-27959_t
MFGFTGIIFIAAILDPLMNMCTSEDSTPCKPSAAHIGSGIIFSGSFLDQVSLEEMEKCLQRYFKAGEAYAASLLVTKRMAERSLLELQAVKTECLSSAAPESCKDSELSIFPLKHRFRAGDHELRDQTPRE